VQLLGTALLEQEHGHLLQQSAQPILGSRTSKD
jgi:hypothetical protein